MSNPLTRCIVVLLALTALAAISGEVVGWRTDGTGKYLSATPPTQWAKDKNVVWKTPLPAWSNATPIIVGDRIFVCAEPDTLICLALADGKILWQKTNGYLEFLTPEQAAKAKDDNQKAAELEKQRGVVGRALNELNGKLKAAPNDAAIKQSIEEKKKEMAQIGQQLAPLSTWRMPATHGTNGFSSCTPTSDGKNVYVLFCSGVAACYDLAGERKWIKMIEKPRHDWGHSASPVLCGDKLLVHIQELAALHTSSGEVAWRAKVPPRWGTDIATRIGSTDVLVTANGEVVRIADGAVLANGLGKLEYCAPVIHDNVVYFTDESGAKAAKLPAQAADKFKAEELWKTPIKKERYYASPVIHDGLLYAIMQKSVFSAIDAKDGKVVYEQALALGNGTIYPSIALAGSYLYVSSDNGTTVVLQPGREYKEVAKNTLEPFRSCPVFLGKRMYVRGATNLWCIGE